MRLRRSSAALGLVATFAALVGVAAPRPARGDVAGGSGITIAGHGRGHGVGGSIAGMANRARAGQSPGQILDFYYPGTSSSRLPGDAAIRVGVYAIRDDPDQVIRLAGGGGAGACAEFGPWSPLRVTGQGVDQRVEASQYLTVTLSGSALVLTVRSANGKAVDSRTTVGDVTVTEAGGGAVRLLDLRSPCADRYRGSVVLHWSNHGTSDNDDDRLWAVERVRLDDYVAGLAEGPDALPMAAREALAITQRSYAWDKVEASRFTVDGFDISSSTAYLPPGYPGGTQLYYGVQGELPERREAVDATAGVIRVYGVEGAILATYSANAGPVTGDPRYEFGLSGPVGYLVEQPDPFFEPDKDDSWTKVVAPDALAGVLGIKNGTVAGFAIDARTFGGRPSRLTLFGTFGAFTTDAPTFRSRLGLPSDFVNVPLLRLAGADRVGTAVAISGEQFPGEAGAVVVVSGDAAHLADALVAAPLAHHLDAPLLFANGDGLDDATRAEIQRLQAANVVVVGGTSAVSEDAAAEAGEGGRRVRRIAGADRYETAVLVADALTGNHADVVIASGEPGHGADALAVAGPAAALGRPILLTRRDEIPAPTAQALAGFRSERTLVIGGRAAVSEGVVAQLPSPTRLAGETRYETSAVVANALLPVVYGDPAQAEPGAVRRLVVASGDDRALSDALAGGGLAAPTVLVPSTTTAGAEPVLYLLAAQRLRTGRVLVLGGPSSVAPAVASRVDDVVNGWH